MTDEKPAVWTVDGSELNNSRSEPEKPHIEIKVVPPESYTEEQKRLAHEVITGAAENALNAVINLIERRTGGVMMLYLPDPAWSAEHQQLAQTVMHEAAQDGLNRVEKIMNKLYIPQFGGKDTHDVQN